MTHTDFICAISRHCERLVRSNVKPDRVTQIRSTLYNFLREVQQDMENQPGLFEHPKWGSGRQSEPGSAGHRAALEAGEG